MAYQEITDSQEVKLLSNLLLRMSNSKRYLVEWIHTVYTSTNTPNKISPKKIVSAGTFLRENS